MQHGKNALEWIQSSQDSRLNPQLREELCQLLQYDPQEVSSKGLTKLEQELLKPIGQRRDTYELVSPLAKRSSDLNDVPGLV